jgi:uncharacterized protein YjbJ (UPF0337 family)
MGRAKQAVGAVTDDEETKREGQRQEDKGKLDSVFDKPQHWLEDLKHRVDRKWRTLRALGEHAVGALTRRQRRSLAAPQTFSSQPRCVGGSERVHGRPARLPLLIWRWLLNSRIQWPGPAGRDGTALILSRGTGPVARQRTSGPCLRSLGLRPAHESPERLGSTVNPNAGTIHRLATQVVAPMARRLRRDHPPG